MSAARCIYCGVIVPWWDCGCPGATEVKAGKREKPRVVEIDGVTVIIADDETVEANHFGLPRYVRGASL